MNGYDVRLEDITKLKPNPKNPNQHDESQIDRLCKLIKHHGFRVPIIISRQSGFIAAGHGRLEASKKLGLSSVPVMYQDFESPDIEYQFMVADNAIQGWSDLDLSKINFDIADIGPFDIELLGLKSFVVEPFDAELPTLSTGEPGLQQVTFTLSNEQKDLLDEGLDKAKKEEDCKDDINQNTNGNALAALLRRYVHG